MHSLKMADSVPLDTALDLVPILGVRLKNIPAVLSDDVRLKLAEHVYSDMEVRDMEVLLILMLFSIFYGTAGKLKRCRNLRGPFTLCLDCDGSEVLDCNSVVVDRYIVSFDMTDRWCVWKMVVLVWFFGTLRLELAHMLFQR